MALAAPDAPRNVILPEREGRMRPVRIGPGGKAVDLVFEKVEVRDGHVVVELRRMVFRQTKRRPPRYGYRRGGIRPGRRSVAMPTIRVFFSWLRCLVYFYEQVLPDFVRPHSGDEFLHIRIVGQFADRKHQYAVGASAFHDIFTQINIH